MKRDTKKRFDDFFGRLFVRIHFLKSETTAKAGETGKAFFAEKFKHSFQPNSMFFDQDKSIKSMFWT